MNNRIYSNSGNTPLIELLDSSCQRVLDVGCGAGDNAQLVRALHPACQTYGITHSSPEAAIAGEYMAHCWVFDLEGDFPTDLTNQSFDVLIFSHVLEHLRDPVSVITRFVSLLQEGGQVLIAVPNILSWRMRIQFLMGRWEYESAGVLDDSHLRFFTYDTADKYLLSRVPGLSLQSKTATGSVPLWLLRRYFLPESWSKRLDEWGCRLWPNLFGGQILIKAVKK